MVRLLTILALALVLVLAISAPAFAVSGADGAGRDFGIHHATHAQDMGGFIGDVNPGVVHRGFSGWSGI